MNTYTIPLDCETILSKKAILNLVKANLAYDRLEDFIHGFIGDSEIGGNMQEISRIFDILISITPLYDPEKTYEETELCK